MMKCLWWLMTAMTLASPVATSAPMAALILFVVTLSITITVAMLLTPWLSLIVFVIVISGVLILFAYFLATQPNQFMKPTLPMICTIFNSVIMMFTHCYLHHPPLTSLPPLTLLLTSPYTPLLMMLTILLLSIMIIVVYNTTNSGSLRPFSSRYDKQYLHPIWFTN